MKNRVYLIGAGIGEGEYLTTRALELIKKCNVIIYDKLIGSSILKHCSADCKKIYVGKSVGKHYKKQEEINQLIIDEALKGSRVVRLKGGDPFVFGRGGEEALALRAAGIDYELVPGVTSSIAAPELAGIPVTHRKISRSFHIYTGHTADDSPIDLKNAAASEGSLVFLMSVGHMTKLAKGLLEYGKSSSTPVAFIENGGYENQRVFRTRLDKVKECIDTNNIVSPSVILIGECAELELCCPQTSVGIVGTDFFVNKLKSKLWGYKIIQRGTMAVKPIYSERLCSEINNIADYEWVVLTSSNGVNMFFDCIKKYSIDIRALANCKFAVIGSGTYETLKSFGIKADFVPSEYSTRCMAKELPKHITGKVLMLRADNSSPLNIQGSVDIPLYALKADEISKCNEDYLVFGSSSGAKSYFEKYDISDKTTVVAIGRATADTIKAFGYDCQTADEFTIDGLIKRIEAIENAKNEKIKD